MAIRQTLLAGLAALLVGCAPKIEEQRFTGSEVVSYGITTKTIKYEGDKAEDKNYEVLFCLNKDDCYTQEKFLERVRFKLNEMEADALYEARVR